MKNLLNNVNYIYHNIQLHKVGLDVGLIFNKKIN